MGSTESSIDYRKSVNLPQTTSTREMSSLLLSTEDNVPVVKSSKISYLEEKGTFALARTNPKHTGNIKITISSDDSIWLNSIDASKELSDDKFKKFRISPDSSYVIDSRNFFDGGTTPNDQVFSLYQDDTQYTSSKRLLSEQFDRFYQYGVEPLDSKFYDEDFRYFAPIYIKDEIPENFIIFRVDGAVNDFSYNKPVSEWPQAVIDEILNSSTIIKTYDLTENSQIGKYLRNLVNHPSRQDDEISISLQDNGYTTFNGISYKEGSFAEKGELLNDFYSEEKTLMNTEEFLTLGFERNGILSSHLINLEFLFDDTDANVYSINRYFGMYVNSVELSKFSLNPRALPTFSRDIGQSPIPRLNVDATPTSQNSFTQTNENGIRIYADIESFDTKFGPEIFTSIVSEVIEGSGSDDLILPGFESIKISMSDFITDKEEVTNLKGDTNDFAIKTNLPI